MAEGEKMLVRKAFDYVVDAGEQLEDVQDLLKAATANLRDALIKASDAS